MRCCRWRRWTVPFVGLASLIWFLVRVGPKPSRVTYPCQRVAGPIAGGFLLWLAWLIGATFAYRQAKHFCRQSRRGLALACLAIAAGAALVALLHLPEQPLEAMMTDALVPLGAAQGQCPGRVVWVHAPGATNWLGPGSGHWWESQHTDQAVVDAMMSRAIRHLAGRPSDHAAWDALIRHFNRTHGRGDVGYTPGEKICVKVNLVGCIASGGTVNATSYDLVGNLDYMNTSPQVMRALLGQLANVVGASESDISIGDPTALFPNQYYEPLHSAFPNVRYLDRNGGNASHPRTAVTLSTVPFYWSARPTGRTQDYVPQAYAEATYFINLANLKSHTAAGVTLCAKNHFGSLRRYPTTGGYYSMHDTLASQLPQTPRYRCLVDLMGHAHTGGKTLLYLIDALYAGVHPVESSPRKWNSAPFNGDWTSSLLASQDPVAIDSVAFDFLWTEWSDYPRMAGADDYLHEAAQAASPPSGTFYDPDHATNTTRLASLGVHEHWDGPTSKKYSRNLGTGDGIELVALRPWSADLDGDGDADAADLTAILACLQGAGVPRADGCANPDIDDDGDVDQSDYGVFQRCLTGPGGAADPNCVR